MQMVHGHCHAGNPKSRFWVIKGAASGTDWNVVENELDQMVDNLPFLIEDDRGVFLSQKEHGEALVEFLEDVCEEKPQWFKERLDHVDNKVWFDRDLSPPTT